MRREFLACRKTKQRYIELLIFVKHLAEYAVRGNFELLRQVRNELILHLFTLSFLSSVEVLSISFAILLPLLRKFFQDEDCRNRADRDTSPTVNTLHRINVELWILHKSRLIFPGMYAIDGASVDAGRILHPYAWLSNYIGHLYLLAPRSGLPKLDSSSCARRNCIPMFCISDSSPANI